MEHLTAALSFSVQNWGSDTGKKAAALVASLCSWASTGAARLPLPLEASSRAWLSAAATSGTPVKLRCTTVTCVGWMNTCKGDQLGTCGKQR